MTSNDTYKGMATMFEMIMEDKSNHLHGVP